MGKRKTKKISIEKVIANLITFICIVIASYFGIQNDNSKIQNKNQITQNNSLQARKC